LKRAGSLAAAAECRPPMAERAAGSTGSCRRTTGEGERRRVQAQRAIMRDALCAARTRRLRAQRRRSARRLISFRR
jgi:hypothetical protein